MKIINLHIPVKLLKELRKDRPDFTKGTWGWGCVANISLNDPSQLTVAYMTPKEFGAFEKAYKKNLGAVKGEKV